jgi:hypothetical protein
MKRAKTALDHGIQVAILLPPLFWLKLIEPKIYNILKHVAPLLFRNAIARSSLVQMAAQSGSFSNVGTSSDASSQLALLDEKMWAVGNMDTSVSKDPAGTISTPAT